jgi:hypothetical protein
MHKYTRSIYCQDTLSEAGRIMIQSTLEELRFGGVDCETRWKSDKELEVTHISPEPLDEYALSRISKFTAGAIKIDFKLAALLGDYSHRDTSIYKNLSVGFNTRLPPEVLTTVLFEHMQDTMDSFRDRLRRSGFDLSSSDIDNMKLSSISFADHESLAQDRAEEDKLWEERERNAQFVFRQTDFETLQGQVHRSPWKRHYATNDEMADRATTILSDHHDNSVLFMVTFDGETTHIAETAVFDFDGTRLDQSHGFRR